MRILVDFKGTLAGYQDGQRLIEAQTHMFSWAQPMLYLPLKVRLVAQMEFVEYYIISYNPTPRIALFVHLFVRW